MVPRAEETESQEPVRLVVEEMSASGKAKVRHVGGWAIRKILEKERKYARLNMNTKDKNTLQKVKASVSTCDLIEETLLSPYAQLESTSSHAETLAVTEARQYRDRGLVHISDACFKVFLYMEQLRVDLMNASSLQKHKQNLISSTLEEMNANDELKTLWLACFSVNDLTAKKVSR